MRRAVVVVWLALGLLVSSAHAEDLDQRVRVEGLDGKRERAVRRAVVEGLTQLGYEVVDDDGDVRAVVTGDMKRERKRWVVKLVVRSGDDGSAVGRTTLRARTPAKLAKVTRKLVGKRLRKPLTKAQPPRPPEPEPEPESEPEPEPVATAEPADDEEPATAAAPVSVRRSATFGGDSEATYAIAGGVQLYQRTFTYRDDLFMVLPTHEAPLSAAMFIRASWFPLAWAGVAGRFAYTDEFESAAMDGTRFPTSSSAWSVGPRVRRELAGLDLELQVDYGRHAFAIGDAPGRDNPGIPDASYDYVRAGSSARLPLGNRWTAGASLGYRHVLALGEVQDMFPRAKAAAVDGQLILEARFGGHLHVELAAELERYFFALRPEPGDTNVAGGALDQYLGARVGVGYRW